MAVKKPFQNIKVVWTADGGISDRSYLEIVEYKGKKFRLLYNVDRYGPSPDISIMTTVGGWSSIADYRALKGCRVNISYGPDEIQSAWETMKETMYNFITALY